MNKILLIYGVILILYSFAVSAGLKEILDQIIDATSASEIENSLSVLSKEPLNYLKNELPEDDNEKVDFCENIFSKFLSLKITYHRDAMPALLNACVSLSPIPMAHTARFLSQHISQFALDARPEYISRIVADSLNTFFTSVDDFGLLMKVLIEPALPQAERAHLII